MSAGAVCQVGLSPRHRAIRVWSLWSDVRRKPLYTGSMDTTALTWVGGPDPPNPGCSFCRCKFRGGLMARGSSGPWRCGGSCRRAEQTDATARSVYGEPYVEGGFAFSPHRGKARPELPPTHGVATGSPAS